MEDVRSKLLSQFVLEIGETQNRLNELETIKVELEEKLSQLRCEVEESREVKVSLEEQLANSNTENKFLSDNLEHEINENASGIKKSSKGVQGFS